MYNSCRVCSTTNYLTCANLQVVSPNNTLTISKEGDCIINIDVNENFTFDIPSGFSWELLGNADTSPAVNFIGTTDSAALVIKTNNIQAGFITATPTADPAVEGGSVILGQYAGQASGTTNRYNTLIGHSAGKNLQHGESVMIGNWAGYYAEGPDPYINTLRSVYVGQSAGYRTYKAGYNVFVGPFAAILNNKGRANTAVGPEVLKSNTDGSNNTALGLYTLWQNTTGIATIDVVTGGSGYTTATVVIPPPLPNAPGTTTRQATATANINAGVIESITVTDPGAGYTDETRVFEFGTYLPASATITGDGIGATASVTLTSGENNLGVGESAGYYNETGKYNTFVGGNTYGRKYDDYVTLVGYGATIDSSVPAGTKLVNATALGKNAKVGDSNTLILGGTGSDTVNVGINTISPRKKLDIVGSDALIHEITIGTGGNSNSNNTALGFEALYSQSGSGSTANTAVGNEALRNGTTYNYFNVALGGGAMKNANLANNTSVGLNSMLNVVNGTFGNDYGFNTAIGNESLQNAVTTANNVVVGQAAAYGITTGYSNTAIGLASMGRGWYVLGGTTGITGTGNTALGQQTLYNLSTGSNNVAIGYNSGVSISSGSYNVILGGNSGASIATLSNYILIADGAGTERQRFNNAGALSFDLGVDYGVSGYILKSNGNATSPSWVDVTTLVPTITASNGLTKTANDIALGGTLTGNTTIAGGGFDLTMNNIGLHTIVTNTGFDYYLGATPRLQIGASGSSIQSPNGTTYFQTLDNTLKLSSTGTTGTGGSSPIYADLNSLTSGTGFNIESSSVSSGSIVNISSTSTAAASNLQKGLNVSLSGVNATSTQTTYGIVSENLHSGTSSTNYGIWGNAANGASNYGVYGTGSNAGVYGLSSSGQAGVQGIGATYGVYGSGTAGIGVYGTSPFLGVQGDATAATTSTVLPGLRASRGTTGTAADGIGTSVQLFVETADGSSTLSGELISKWTTAALATRTSQFIITGVNSAVTGDIISFEGNKRTITYGRLQTSKGADVAAANDLTLGLDGNVFHITGATQVNAITTANWQAGSEITLIFDSTPTVKNNTAGGGGTAVLLLAGAADFVASANDVLKLVYDGTSWFEVSRSVN